jgi:ribosome-associated translation inhibitor RaiA
MTTEQTTAVRVTVRGTIAEVDREYAVRKIEAVLASAHAPVLGAHLVLELEGEHAHEHRAHAEIGLDLKGAPVRAHASAAGVPEAADLVQERLRRRLIQRQDRTRSRGRFTRATQPPERPSESFRATSPRPSPPDRMVLRRKTFALRPLTVDEAAGELEVLDHDFYLFEDRETGADSVICHRAVLEGAGAPAGGEPAEPDYLVLVSAPVLSEELARERLEVGQERFVFYRDPGDGRGRILYRRRDGHDGLITPV